MQIKQFTLAALAALGAATAHAVDGLVAVQSSHAVGATVDRLEAGLGKAGFRIFARVDHAAGAKSVDMPLAPTELLIFGNPKGGTALMQSERTVAIDLPMKYLVWEDAAGAVMIGWNDPGWLAARHGIADRAPVVDKMTGALRKFAVEAAAP
jgi:uncharacterized protein (DUF302 family)